MRRIFLWIGRSFVIFLALGLVVGYWFANRYYNNEALGDRISAGFNKNHRGRLEIRRVHWRPSVIWGLARRGYDEVEVQDLKIYDSRGELAAHVPRAVGRIRLWDIILRGDFFLEHLTFSKATVRLEEYTRPDGPNKEGVVKEIGLLGAFEKRPIPLGEKEPTKPSDAKRRSYFVVDRFDVKGVHVEAVLGDKRLTLEDLRLAGQLRYASGVGTRSSLLSYDLRPGASRGILQLGTQRFGIQGVSVTRLQCTPKEPDKIIAEANARVEGARLTLVGGIRGLGGKGSPTVAATGEARGFGEFLAKATGRQVRDEGSLLTANVSGTLASPVATLKVKGLGLDHDEVRVSEVAALARYEGGLLRVHRFSSRLLDGTLKGRAELHPASGKWQATFIADRLFTGSLVPPGREDLRGRLSGWLDAAGALDDPSRGWTRFDLLVHRDDPTGPLPPSVRAHGSLHATRERLDIRQVEVESALFTLDARGRFWPQTREMDLALKADARRLRRFLMQLGKPPLLAALTVVGRVTGRMENPRFTGRGTAYGVQSGPVTMQSLAAGLTLRDGTLGAHDLQGSVFGGRLRGTAQVGIYRGDVRRMRPHPLISASGGVTGLDLEPATGGAVEALVNGTFQVRGTPDFLRGRVRARSGVVWWADHWYRDASMDVAFRGSRYTVHSMGLRREEGGEARVSGVFSTGPRGKIDLKVDVSRLPLAALPGLDREPGNPPVSGEVSTQGLRVLGSFAEPVLEGTVRLLGVALRGVPAGDGAIELRQAGDHSALSGNILSFLRIATGKLHLGRDKGVSLRLAFTEVPLEKYLPELGSQGKAEGRVSGTLDLDLSAEKGIRLAKLTVDKLALRVEKPEDPFEDLPAEVAEIRNSGPIQIRYEDGRLVVDRCMLTDKDDLHRLLISGALGPDRSRLRIHGRVNLLPLEILLAQRFRRLRGVIGVDVVVSGTPSRPRVRGTLHPAGVMVRAHRLGGDMVVRAGRLLLSNEAIGVEGLRLQVMDDEAEVNGRVTMRDFVPQELALTVRGALSPRVLELFLGETVSRARGQPSQLDLRVSGKVAEPVITGRVVLGQTQLGLRSAGKELALQSGVLVFRAGVVKLQDIRGKLDEGPFALNGDVYLRGFDLDGMDLHFVGESIPHRSGGIYEVEVSPDVKLVGRGNPASGYSLTGVVDVVEGRYIQKFDINPMSRLISPSRTVESSAPFYDGSPLLENLQLNLTVATTGNLRVKNNLADVGLEGNLSVTGTLPNMRIGGTVDIKEGTFRVPFLRGRYGGAQGTIDFDRGRAEGKHEAYVNLEGTTIHTDRSETDHEITLTIQGYVSRLVPTWSSNTGLTSSQTLTLLVTSRTPDELRRGRSVALPNMAPLIEDYIPVDLQLDLSSDAVQVFVERRLGRYFRVKGEGEFGYSGSQRQEGVIVYRVLDNLSLEGRIRRRVLGEDITEEDKVLTGRVEAKYRIQLRGGLRRSLGF